MDTLKPKTDPRLAKLNALLESVRQRTSGANRKIAAAAGQFKQPKQLVGGSLKDYQLEALMWMAELSERGMNAILADDMGLGKTIQAISYFAHVETNYKIRGKHLIVVPKSTSEQWLSEVNKWLPNYRAVILHGRVELREDEIKDIVRPGKFDILIATYSSMSICCRMLARMPWQSLIVDEAHKIKNCETLVSQQLRLIRSNFKLLLTGTPISNHLDELWALLNFILPDVFSDRDIFGGIEEMVNELEGTEEERMKLQCELASKFHNILRPFIKRRTKKQVNLSLPTKTEHVLFMPMTKLQLKMYKNFLKFRSVHGPNGQKLYSLQMQCRKICNHPFLFDGIPKVQATDLQAENMVELCGKMRLLDKLLKYLIPKGHKVLIFSQFVIQLNVLAEYCTLRQYPFVRFDGNVDDEERKQNLKSFKGADTKIFLISTRSGGLGLNLVEADVVIIYDIDWNPQNDCQAMDRAYRIGQTKPVHVFKLITENTIEERMLEVQKYKLIWDELVIQQGALMGRGKKEDIISSLDFNKIVNIGKNDIFRLQLQCDNKTIEELIQLGQEKNKSKHEEIKQKLLEKLGAIPNLDPTNVLLEQEDEEACAELKEYGVAQYIDQSTEGICSQRRRGGQDYQSRSCIKKRKFYHLYPDPNRLMELEKELHEAEQNQDKEKAAQLSAQIEAEQMKGFPTWTVRDLRTLIGAAINQKTIDTNVIGDALPHRTKEECTKYIQALMTSKDPQAMKWIERINNASKKFQKDQEVLEEYSMVRDIPYTCEFNNPKKTYNYTVLEDFAFKQQVDYSCLTPAEQRRAIESSPIFPNLLQMLGSHYCTDRMLKVHRKNIQKKVAETKDQIFTYLEQIEEKLIKEYILKSKQETSNNLKEPLTQNEQPSDTELTPKKKRKHRKKKVVKAPTANVSSEAVQSKQQENQTNEIKANDKIIKKRSKTQNKTEKSLNKAQISEQGPKELKLHPEGEGKSDYLQVKSSNEQKKKGKKRQRTKPKIKATSSEQIPIQAAEVKMDSPSTKSQDRSQDTQMSRLSVVVQMQKRQKNEQFKTETLVEA